MKSGLILAFLTTACFASAIPFRAADSRYVWVEGQGSGTDSTFAPFAIATTGVGPGDVTSNPLAVAYVGERKATTTITDTAFVGDTKIRVADTMGVVPGHFFYMFDTTSLTFDQFEVLSIIAPDTVVVDVPVGNVYPAGSFAYAENVDMNIDGSTTPVQFLVRPPDIEIPAVFRITRIIFTLLTATTGSIDDFGDIAGGLTNGVFLRRTDGTSRTIINLKKNVDFAQVAYDLEEFPAAGPFGADGFRCRLTFARMGGVVELAQGENLELWVQDDLSSLVRFRAVVEGTFGAPAF